MNPYAEIKLSQAIDKYGRIEFTVVSHETNESKQVTVVTGYLEEAKAEIQDYEISNEVYI